MNKKKLLIRILCVVVALGVGTYFTIQLKEYMASERPREKVLVAKENIAPYTVIKSGHLQYVVKPEGSRMSESIQNPKEIVGKRTKSTIYANEQILPEKLAKTPFVLSDKQRAVGIPVDIIKAVGMNIKPGNHVDVYWMAKTDDDKGYKNDKEAVKEAERIAVNATILDILNKNNTSMFNLAKQDDKNKNPNVAVLKIKNSEVKDVITAVGNGTVYLAKRKKGGAGNDASKAGEENTEGSN